MVVARKTAIALCGFLLSSCDQRAKSGADTAREIVRLQTQISDLTSRVQALEQPRKGPDPETPTPTSAEVDLKLSDSGRRSTVAYRDMDACKAAQEVALAESARRVEAFKSHGIGVEAISATCTVR